jgi:hypothetical protein
VEGIIPAYRVPLPDKFRAYTVAFRPWRAWADAAYMIWDTGIGYLFPHQHGIREALNPNDLGDAYYETLDVDS